MSCLSAAPPPLLCKAVCPLGLLSCGSGTYTLHTVALTGCLSCGESRVENNRCNQLKAVCNLQAPLGIRAVTQQICSLLLSHPVHHVLLILDNADAIIKEAISFNKSIFSILPCSAACTMFCEAVRQHSWGVSLARPALAHVRGEMFYQFITLCGCPLCIIVHFKACMSTLHHQVCKLQMDLCLQYLASPHECITLIKQPLPLLLG